MDKLLVKDRPRGKDLLSRDESKEIDPTLEPAQKAFDSLTSDQIDRYYRARKVFYVPKKDDEDETFEFEDESV